MFGVVRAELALLLKGQSAWWYVGLLGFLIAELAAPLKSVREVVLPIASFWPALVWSALGHREQRYATGGVLFSCPQPVARLLPAAWLAGAVLMLFAGAPALVRLLLAGETPAALGWLLAAAFVPGAGTGVRRVDGRRQVLRGELPVPLVRGPDAPGRGDGLHRGHHGTWGDAVAHLYGGYARVVPAGVVGEESAGAG